MKRFTKAEAILSQKTLGKVFFCTLYSNQSIQVQGGNSRLCQALG